MIPAGRYIFQYDKNGDEVYTPVDDSEEIQDNLLYLIIGEPSGELIINGKQLKNLAKVMGVKL